MSSSDQVIEISNESLILRREGNVDITSEGTYDISYHLYAVNDLDLSSTSSVTFNIIDTTPPTISINSDNPLYILKDSVFTNPDAEAFDTRGTELTDQIIVLNIANPDSPNIDTSIIGQTILTYRVTDPINGQITDETLEINVVETLNPSITLIGSNELTLVQFDSINDPGADAINYDGSTITENIVTDYSDVCMNILGTYTATYTITNDLGYSASVQRTIIVEFQRFNYTISITDNGSSGYDISGRDRTGEIQGINHEITLQTGDSLTFEVDSTNNPVFIRSQNTVDINDNVSGVNNNGAIDNSIFWLTDTSGTYYYNSEFDIDMGGTIVINDHPSLIPTQSLPETWGVTVTAPGSYYSLTGDDRNGGFSGTNSTININVGDTLELIVDVTGHPLWIKSGSSQITGTSNGVSDPAASNNGATSGTISWTPNTAGTYYYICQYHSSMVGTIIVS